MPVNLDNLPDDAPADVSAGVDLEGLPDSNKRVLEQQYRLVKTPPEAEAKVVRLRKLTGLPDPVVRNNTDQVERKAQEPDWSALESSSPRTVEKLVQDADFFKIAHQDIKQLSFIEELLKYGRAFEGSLSAALPRSIAGLQGAAHGILRNYADALGAIAPGDKLLGPVRLFAYAGAEGAHRGAKKMEQTAGKIRGDLSEFNSTEQAVFSGVESAAQSSMNFVLAALTGNPELATLWMMSTQTAGQSYEQAIEKGVDPAKALTFAVSQGLIEGATELIPVGRFWHDVKAGTPFYQLLARQLTSEVPQEQVATLLQDLNEWAVLNPDKPFTDYLKDRPEAAYQTLVSTVVATVLQSSASKVVQQVMEKTGQTQDIKRVLEAERVKDVMTKLGQAAQESKLAELSPDKFGEFVDEAAADGGAQNVYVDARDFAQYFQDQGVDPQSVVDTLPSAAEQFQEAFAAGGDIKIPIGEFAKRFATTDYYQTLIDHVKFTPNGMSPKDAAEWHKNLEDEFKARAERILNQGDEAFQKSADNVYNAIRTQLIGTRRFTDDVASAYAAMHRAFAVTMAARENTTPEEFYKKYQLQVQAEPVVTGQQYEQTSNPFADRGQQWWNLMTPEQQQELAQTAEIKDVADKQWADLDLKAREALARVAVVGATTVESSKSLHEITQDRLVEILNNAALSEPSTFERRGLVDRRGIVRNAVERRTQPATTLNEITERRLAALLEAERNAYDQSGLLKTDTPAFKAWFGNSKIVDDNGDPMIVYHSAKEGLPKKFDKRFKTDLSALGFHFGTEEQAAFRTTQYDFHGHKVATGQYYLSIQNPLEVTHMESYAPDHIAEKMMDMGLLTEDQYDKIREKHQYDTEAAIGAELVKRLKKAGYDGLKYLNTMEGEGYSYVPFDSAQIKSVENKGTFNPKSENVYEQGPLPPKFETYRAEQEARPISDMIKEPLVNKDGKYRKNANGDITGAPPGIKTKRQITAIVNRNIKALEDPMSQLPSSAEWYEVSGDAIRAVTHGDPQLAENMVRMMAVLSATNQVGGNVTGAIRAIYQLAAGETPAAGRFPVKFKEISQKIIDAADMTTEVPGVDSKVMSFYRNLWDATFQSNKYENAATMDLWMARLYGYDLDTFGQAQYRFANYVTRQIADKYNAKHGTTLKPRQIQAALWVYARNRERFGANLGAELAVADRSAFDTYINRAKQHITVEAVPSVTSGLFPEILDAPLQTREQFTQDALGLLLDEDGQNGLFRRLHVPLYETSPGSGSFEGRVNPNEILSLVSQKVGGKVDTSQADLAAKALIYIYSQDAVPWFQLDPTLKGGTKGYSVGFSEEPSAEVQEAFLEHLGKYDVAADFTRIGRHLFLLNYTSLSDKKFSDIITRAVHEYDGPGAEQITELGNVKATGNYVTQDWSNESRALAQLEADLAARGSRDLLSWVRGRREAFGRLIADYRDQLAGRTAYAQSSAQGLRQGTGGSDTPPIRRDGSVELTHWSKREGLQELDPAHHGDGLSGAESKRKANDPQNWVNRTYYGIAVGQPGGYVRERGLGPHRYTAALQVDKLYDFKTDPDKLYPRARSEAQETGGLVHSIYERLVRDSGYEGYWIKDPSMGLVAAVFTKLTPEKHELQQGGGGQRGSISFASDITQQPSIISLLQNADLSTFLHETGHFFLEVLSDVASREGSSEGISKDMQLVLDWFGIDSIEAWRAMTPEERRVYHERFARGFEAYLFEGKAPSIGLRGLFQRFRSWLVNVYKSLRGLKVNLSDEVRGVFDRMLATEEEIQQAEALVGYGVMFDTKPEGMTNAEWTDYQAQAQTAHAMAIDELNSRGLADMRWVQRARSRIITSLQKEAQAKRKAVRAEIATEVGREPVYAARNFLSRGILPEGFATQNKAQRKALEASGLLGSKLSIPALKEMYGEGGNALWRYLPTGRYGLIAKEGIHPDLVATLFGFKSGDEMIRAMLSAEDQNVRIEGLTDQRMIEQYGDLSNPAEIARAADEAIHNEARGRFIATELRYLNRVTGRKNVNLQVARAFAEEHIARQKVRDITPGRYTAAEAKAARAADQARRKGDLPLAARAKQDQLVQSYTAKAAHRALDEVARDLRYLRKFTKTGVRKGLSQDYLDQIDALLERFDLKARSLKAIDQRTSLADWVKSQQENFVEPVIDERLLNEAQRTHYKNMRLEELRGLVDTIKNIEHLGRLKLRLLTAKDQREFAVIVDAIDNQIRSSKKARIKDIETRLPKDSTAHTFGSYLAAHRKMASFVRQMDGFKDGGIVWATLIRPLNERGDYEAVQREKATLALAKLFGAYSAREMGKMYTKQQIPGTNKSLTKMGRLMMALNWGNEANRQRLVDGYATEGWTQNDIEAAIDMLDKRDWEFVQGVWDQIDSYWPEIAAKEKRVNGVAPEKVEATPIQTKYGEYRGGYFPIKYDDRQSPRAYADAAKEAADQAMRGKYSRATTRRGHTKARAEHVERPVRLDFGVIFEHVEQVIHDLSYHEYLIDANRLLGNKAIQSAIIDTYGPEVYKMMQNAITDVAAGTVPGQTAFERGINWLRSGASIAAMGWNFSTSLLQPLGLSQSFVRIGPKWVAKGMSRWLRDSVSMENTAAWIFERSDFMRLRSKTMYREINEIRNKVSEQNARQKILGPFEDTYFWMIAKAQLIADIPTWLGEYEKAMAAGRDEKTAIQLANQAVIDSQGGGQVKDLAQIQRGGPLMKLFTNFYSYFNVTYNLTAESFRQTNFKSPASIAKLGSDLIMLYTVPAVLGWILRNALLRGDCDFGSDIECVERKLTQEQIGYTLGVMVGLREIGGAAMGYGGYEGPAGLRFFAEFGQLAQQVQQGEVDAAAIKAANQTAGILFHYPASQAQRTVDGAAAMYEGETANPAALVLGTPPKH